MKKKTSLEFLKKYPACEIDMSGSRYLLLLLFEEAIRQKSNIWYYDEKKNSVRNYFSRLENIPAPFLLLEDMLLLAGGKITRQLHQEPDMNDVKTIKCLTSFMPLVIPTYAKFLSSLVEITRVLKRNEEWDSQDENNYPFRNNTYVKLLIDHQLLVERNNKISYRNSFIESLFEVSGAWLETYLYILLKKSNEFEEVKMSVKIDFSNRRKPKLPVFCEIDVMAIRQNRLLFFSCKSNKVDSPALNEIALHNLYFGNELSKALMVTFEKTRKRNPLVAAKAEELGICLIDQENFRYSIIDKIKQYLQRR